MHRYSLYKRNVIFLHICLWKLEFLLEQTYLLIELVSRPSRLNSDVYILIGSWYFLCFMRTCWAFMLVTVGKTQVYKHQRGLKLGVGWGRDFSQENTILSRQKNKTKQNKCLLKAQMDKSLTSSFGLCNKSLQRIRWRLQRHKNSPNQTANES